MQKSSRIMIFWVLLLVAMPAGAHNVTIFAWVEGDTVFTESKFSGGRKAVHAPVGVYDASGEKLLEGKTDANGDFSFRIPQKTALKVVLEAGMGHRAEWTLPLEEIAPGGSVPKTAAALPDTPEPPGTTKTGTVPVSGLTAGEIEAAVERAVDRKLKPLMKLLAERRREGPSASDIFSGIGYIFGLVGVGVYFHYRRKRE